jgi:hypothetical protein
MARLDVHARSSEWATNFENFQMGGDSLLFAEPCSSPLNIIAERVETPRFPKAKQLPKKLTRKIRRSAPRSELSL